MSDELKNTADQSPADDAATPASSAKKAPLRFFDVRPTNVPSNPVFDVVPILHQFVRGELDREYATHLLCFTFCRLHMSAREIDDKARIRVVNTLEPAHPEKLEHSLALLSRRMLSITGVICALSELGYYPKSNVDEYFDNAYASDNEIALHCTKVVHDFVGQVNAGLEPELGPSNGWLSPMDVWTGGILNRDNMIHMED